MALATAVALGVVAPWSARNCRVMRRLRARPPPTLGWNLAIGAFPRATGRFLETLRAHRRLHPVVTSASCPARPCCWMNEGLRWIANDPGRWLRLVPDKLSFTFDHESFPMGYLGEADPAAWPEARKAQGRDLLSGVHRALLGLAALAVVSWPFARGMRTHERLVQGALLLLTVVLAARGLLLDTHPA